MIKLSIIIVHYKTYDLTLRCVQSIVATTTIAHEIIVVDNNSNDDAGEKIINDFPSINWIYNSENEGFGRANNLGASKAKGDFLLFMNSDMLIPEGTIENCLQYINENPKIGVLGPKLLNEDGSIQKSTYHFVGDHQEILQGNLLLDKLLKFKTPPLKAVMGSFMIIPKNVFKKVNGFDPDFFMYCEELELCARISNIGFQIEYLDNEYAIHKHGGSSSTSEWVVRQTYLSRSLLVLKQKGVGGYIIHHFILHFNFTTNFLLMWFLDKDYRKDFWSTYKSYFSNWLTYWRIPFTFTRNLGKGSKLLKSA